MLEKPKIVSNVKINVKNWFYFTFGGAFSKFVFKFDEEIWKNTIK